MAAISLICLVLVIVIANFKKINIGIVAFGMACLLGTIAGFKAGDIISGFGTTLFLRMLSFQMLLTIARINGTLEVISVKIMKVGCGRAIRLLPIFVYIALIAAEFMGMGIYSLMIPLLAALAYELKYKDMLKLVVVGMLSMQAGGLAPLAPPGIALKTYAAEAGMDINSWNIAILTVISTTVLFVIVYFYYGWHKEQPREITEQNDVKFNKYHVLTILSYVALVVSNLVFKMDMMIVPVIASTFLMAVKAAKPEQVIKEMPFPILVMIGGMTIMVGVVIDLGGVTLLASGIALVANKTLAPVIYTLIAGAMTLFSSATTVIMPTMIPTIPELSSMLGGLNMQGMVAAIGVGAYATAISPMSTAGASVMAAYGSVYQPSEEDRLKIFNKILIFAGIALVYQMVLNLVGFYNISFF